jgi:signal transduction histidine kinase
VAGRAVTARRWSGADGAGLLPRVLAVFFVAVAVASLVTLLLETRLTRQQLEDQAVTLFGETGDVLEARIASDAVRTNQLMSTVSQQVFAASRGSDVDADELARRTLSVVRTSDAPLEIVAVVEVATGEVRSLGLPSRDGVLPPDPVVADEVARRGSSTQRVVPLQDGGFGLVYALAVERLDSGLRLLVTGYPLNGVAARRYLQQTGVDEIELVVSGEVVAATTPDRIGGAPLGGWEGERATQRLEDGRLVRYVALGADRAWDTPAAVGLITDDPLGALDAALSRTRILMIVLLLVVGGAVSFALARVMTRPLVVLTATATAIAAGDLDRSFDIDRTDDIGRLADALERMRRGLRAQLLVIRRQAEALQDAARRMVGVQDAERQRIAQDLHDGIQQQLVVLRMQVGAAERELEAHPDRLGEVIQRLAEAIDHLLDQLRSTSQQLFPAILRDRGLGPALFSLTARLELPVDLSFTPDPLPRVEPEVEVNAYFLVSEAVLNAVKHARAGRLHVDISVDETHLYVHVHDDGIGFDPHGQDHRGGLRHMADRVQALGGVLDLTAAPGEGTRVDAAFPLQRSAGSVVGALQVEQDRGDAAVEVDLLGEAELAEDRVRVLLDGTVGDGEFPRDRGIPPT